VFDTIVDVRIKLLLKWFRFSSFFQFFEKWHIFSIPYRKYPKREWFVFPTLDALIPWLQRRVLTSLPRVELWKSRPRTGKAFLACLNARLFIRICCSSKPTPFLILTL
jgi:hypothetical protein